MSFLRYPVRFVFALLILSVFLLTQTGCASTQEVEKVVYKTRTVYVSVPDSLTVTPPPNKPMAKEAYLALIPQEREVYLSKLIKELYGDLNSCQGNLKAIKKIQNTSKEAVDHERQSGS